MNISDVLAAGLVKYFGKHDIVVTGDFSEEGEITLRYRVIGSKGEPESYTPTISIPWKYFVANLFDLIGSEVAIGVDLIGQAMAKAFEDAKSKKTDPRLESVLNPVTEAAQNCIQKMLSDQPKSTREGKTKFSVLDFEVVATPMQMPAKSSASEAA